MLAPEVEGHGVDSQDGLVECRPVGRVVGGRSVVEDDDWGLESAVIRLDGARFGPEALFGPEVLSRFGFVKEYSPLVLTVVTVPPIARSSPLPCR